MKNLGLYIYSKTMLCFITLTFLFLYRFTILLIVGFMHATNSIPSSHSPPIFSFHYHFFSGDIFYFVEGLGV